MIENNSPLISKEDRKKQWKIIEVKNLLENAPLLTKRELINLGREEWAVDEAVRQLTSNHALLEKPIANYDLTLQDEPLNIVYDADLINIEDKKIEWVVEGLIPKNSICFIGGKRGVFKSFLALNMAYSVASGMKVFNSFMSKATKVLYLDEENGLPLLKERAMKIKNGLGLVNNCEIAFLSFANFKLDKSQWMDKLEDFLIKFKPEIIIVDSLRRFVSFEENDAGEVSKLFTEILRPISQKFNITWILLHHLRKGISGRNPTDEMDELRGSSDLSNYADVVLILNRNRGSIDSIILKQVKNRYMQELKAKTLKLSWEDRSLIIDCVGDAEESIFADEVCSKFIISWMGENEIKTFKTQEILKAMKDKKQTKPTIERALKLLIEQGKLLKSQRGVYELCVDKNLKSYFEPSKPQNHQDGNEIKQLKENEPSEPSNFNSKRLLRVQNSSKRTIEPSDTIYSEGSDGSKKCVSCGSQDGFIVIDGTRYCPECARKVQQ